MVRQTVTIQANQEIAHANHCSTVHLYKLGHVHEYDAALADADPEDEGAFEDADGHAAHAEEAAKPEMGSPHADAFSCS